MANKYRYNNYPIIQGGTFTTRSDGGQVDVSFASAFRTSTVYVVCNITGYTNYFMVSCYIWNKSSTGFSVAATYKDGRNGDKGGGYWNGTGNYIAISEDFIYYNSSSNAFITGSNITGNASYIYPNALGTSSDESFLVVNPTGDSDYFIIGYSIYNNTGTGSVVLGTFKDGRAGQDGGGYWTGTGNYIAAAINSKTEIYKVNGVPIIQGGEFTTNESTPTTVGTFGSGTKNVTFSQPFPTGSTVYVVAISSQSNATNLVTVSINNITTTGFTAVAFYKNSSSNQSGGGSYNGLCNYIAICIV